MKRERKKDIKEANRIIDSAISLLNEYIKEIDFIKGEEEFDFDNLSDSAQDGPKGEKMQDEIDTMDEVINAMEKEIDSINEIKTKIGSL